MADRHSNARREGEPLARRLQADLGAAVAAQMVALGDRVGLWRALHQFGPCTSTQLATRSGLNECYVQEWLAAVASAGYVAFDPATARYSLSVEGVASLADEGDPQFAAGRFGEAAALSLSVGRVARAFRQGGGVPMADYDACLWEAMVRRAPAALDLAALPG